MRSILVAVLLISANARADDCDITDAAGGTASTWVAEALDRCMADPSCATMHEAPQSDPVKIVVPLREPHGFYLGLDGTAGEIGHQVIDMYPDAPRCGCGNTGCLEAFVGAAHLAEAAGTATAAEAFAADERGEARAHAAVEAWIDYLAIGLANLVTVLTPDRIVLGGGVASAASRIIVPLRERLAAHVHLTDPNHVEIVHAALGVRAGAIGAALHGFDISTS